MTSLVNRIKTDPGSSCRSLRAHDIHQGLQAADIDRSSGLVGEELEATQVVGMAAALATAVKGLDYVPDANELKRVASQQYDIPTLAFARVVELLAEIEFVRRIEKSGPRIQSFYENVPEDFDRLYATLDQAYVEQRPTEIDQSLLTAVDELSMGPRLMSEISVDPEALPRLLELADAAEAIKAVEVGGETVAFSPYFAYENPEEMGSILSRIEVADVRRSFQQVRGYQGTPILDDTEGGVLRGLVGAGLMAGPHLVDPDGDVQVFAMAPYGLPRQLLVVEKVVLDRAMAIVASVRMGQNWGGVTHIRNPVAILNALLEPGRWVARHSSTERQYSVLYQLGIVRFDDAAWKAMQLIDTSDNRRAVEIAKDLLRHGEAMSAKEHKIGNLALPDASGNYRTPIQSIKPARRRTPAPRKVITDVISIAMGWKPSV